jgi:hypothetical protein
MTDEYGDLSGNLSFSGFLETGSPVYLYTSQTHTNGFSLSGAIGLSYGINENMFFDIGARATFIPKIKWALNNDANGAAQSPKERDIFSAENIIFTSVYAGLRFEF